MARTGRPRKPTVLKILHGTFRKDRAPKREPKPPRSAKVPPPPKYLGAIAKAEWKIAAAAIHKWGGLGKGDLRKLALYCQAVGRNEEAENIITEQGMTFMTDKGYVCQRPEVAIAKSYALLARQLGSDFGLDPSARTRIEAPEQKPDSDVDEDFLMGDSGKKTG